MAGGGAGIALGQLAESAGSFAQALRPLAQEARRLAGAHGDWLLAAVVALDALLAAWVCSRPRRRAVEVRENALAKGARALLFRLAAADAVARLAQERSWARACDEVVRRAARRGVALSRREAAALVLVAGAALGLVLSALSLSPVGLLLAPMALAVGVPLWAQALERRDRRELGEEMPAVFRTLAMAISSGETLPQAIDYLGRRGTGRAAPAFARSSLRLRCGSSVEEALSRLPQELPGPGVGLLSVALVISQRTGSPLAGLLEHAARLAERQGESERMLMVKTAQVRLSVRVVCVLPALVVALLSLVSPDFRAGVATPVGLGSIVVAAALDAVALLAIRRIMRGVLS